MNTPDTLCKDLEEFNDYILEYLEKSGFSFYGYYIKLNFSFFNLPTNQIKRSIRNKFKK